MNARAIAAAVLAGSVTMFGWQSLSQTVIPWHTATIRPLADSTVASVAAIRKLAPENGVYFGRYGVLMAVRISPDNADQTSMAAMGPMLARQAAVNLVVVAALCILSGMLADRSALGVGKAAALAGLAMVGLQEASLVIWYGFSPGWAAVNVADQSITFLLTGLVIGAVFGKLDPDRGVSIPPGQGYRTSGGRKTLAR